jgi:hypothetical protein
LPELKSHRIKEKSAEAVLVPGVSKDRILSEEAADGLLIQSEGYMNKKTEVYEAEEKNIHVQRLQRKGTMKKEKTKSAAPPTTKSCAVGGAVSMPKMAMEISQPSVDKSPDEQFFGGMALIGSLVRDVETRVFESIPISDLVQYYRDYDSFAKDRFSPEDIVPGTSDAKVNPAFVSGISPLASMGGFDYRYELGGTVDSIRSTGTPVQIGVDIARFSLTLAYISVPIENEAVYLKASFKNTYRNPLPQGPAQVFSGNNFLGNIIFPTVGRNEQTSLSLGIDRDIKIVRREKAERKTGGFVRKEIVTEYRIEIELVSYKDEVVTVDVYERIPISEKPKEVEVTGVTSTPDPFFVTERNVVIFRIELAPREKKKIEVSYSLKHPEDFRLTLRNAGHPHFDSEGGRSSWRR